MLHTNGMPPLSTVDTQSALFPFCVPYSYFLSLSQIDMQEEAVRLNTKSTPLVSLPFFGLQLKVHLFGIKYDLRVNFP